MDIPTADEEIRMECARIAERVTNKAAGDVVTMAQRIYDFVKSKGKDSNEARPRAVAK
jgi:hypothetical protein